MGSEVNLSSPNAQEILKAIDKDTLRSNWENQLAHQISKLPPFESYFVDLEDALVWWLHPELAKPELEPHPNAVGAVVDRILFPKINWKTGPTSMDIIRQAARNKFCAIVSYHGSTRIVEPYSLRYPRTGSEILHVWETEKNDSPSNQHKSFKTNEIDGAKISDVIFNPKWIVEL